MKLIALKTLSNKRPKGAIFEEPNPRAKMLVAIGVAEVYVEPPTPAVKPAPAPVAAKPAAQAPPVTAQPAAPAPTVTRTSSPRRQSTDR